jgi:ribosomal protein L11 methyltransferase
VSDWPNARREEFVSFTLEFESDGSDDQAAALAAVEDLTAACFEAGAAGVEERSSEESSAGEPTAGHRVELIVYAPRGAFEDIADAARSFGARCAGDPEAVEDVDWSRSWQAGFDAIEVCPALVIRPSFVASQGKPGQREIVIDPGQAFGTGGHASTKLVLDVIAAESSGFDATTRVLDVGTGTGVLALAAVALGAGRAVGFDLDPLAAHEACNFARANDLAASFDVFAGGIESLSAAPFDLVLANLLRREMLPIAGALAACTAGGGKLVLSGLLDVERDKVEAALVPFGLETVAERGALDANGDRWISLVMARA